MSRKETIKVLREIIRNLKDNSLFLDEDFEDFFDPHLPDVREMFNVKQYIFRKLKL